MSVSFGNSVAGESYILGIIAMLGEEKMPRRFHANISKVFVWHRQVTYAGNIVMLGEEKMPWGFHADVAMVTVSAAGEPYHVGNLDVLGGEQEMPWRFNRLFKLEITKALSDLGLNYDDEFEVHLDITDQDNNPLPENTFGHDTILHQAAKGETEQGHF